MTIWTDTMDNTLYTPFGPILMKGVMSDELHTALLKKSEDSRNPDNDFRHHLAGNLTEEYKLNLSNEEKESCYAELLDLAQTYMLEAKKEKRIKKFGRPKIKDLTIVEPIWVNYMKAGEWNPSHFHAGLISCVAYLSVPEEIEIENVEAEHSKQSNIPSAGRIQWTYGESIQFSETYFTQIPKAKDIWFFPAELKHYVYPFKSDVERVSISCNFK